MWGEKYLARKNVAKSLTDLDTVVAPFLFAKGPEILYAGTKRVFAVCEAKLEAPSNFNSGPLSSSERQLIAQRKNVLSFITSPYTFCFQEMGRIGQMLEVRMDVRARIAENITPGNKGDYKIFGPHVAIEQWCKLAEDYITFVYDGKMSQEFDELLQGKKALPHEGLFSLPNPFRPCPLFPHQFFSHMYGICVRAVSLMFYAQTTPEIEERDKTYSVEINKVRTLQDILQATGFVAADVLQEQDQAIDAIIEEDRQKQKYFSNSL